MTRWSKSDSRQSSPGSKICPVSSSTTPLIAATFTGSVTPSRTRLEPGHAVAVRGDGPVPLPWPLPADVGLADELDLAGIDAEEPGGEAAGRLVVVLRPSWSGSDSVADVPMQMISSGVFPARARTRRIRQATSAPVAPAVGVGLVEDEVLERGLGEERHVGQPGGQDLQLAVVGQQDAGLPLADVLLGAALLGRCQGTHGPVFGLGFFPPLLAGGQVGVHGPSRGSGRCRHRLLGRASCRPTGRR